MYAADRIFDERRGSCFVFGSNLAGRHGAGAAFLAAQRYGAVQGIGIGLGLNTKTGVYSYALPTKDLNIETLPLDCILDHVLSFNQVAECLVHINFFVTKIGCGLAGYTEDDIAPMFRGLDWRSNVILPAGWCR